MATTKLQVIGDRFEVMRYPLRWRGMRIENIIGNCNPLAMAGHKDPDIAVRAEEINSVPMRLMANGNLAQMLSHNESDFEDNIKYADYAHEVKYKNESEYIIVCNDLCGYPLYSYRGSVYSDTYPRNELLYDIVNDSDCRALTLPYTAFDWKAPYDAFIDAILGAYDSDHIILIKSNVMHWYQDSGRFIAFTENTRDVRNQIEEMDARFAERTGCHCVDVMYAHIPNNAPYAFDVFPYLGAKESPYTIKYVPRTSAMYKELEYALDDIINRGSESCRGKICSYSTLFEQRAHRLLSRDILVQNADELSSMKSGMSEGLERVGGSDFSKNLHKLARFLDGEQHYTLTDYILAHMEIPLTSHSIQLLELAVEYLKLGMNELVSIYQLYLRLEDKKQFCNLVAKICANSDCIPLQCTQRLINRNIECLAEYRYVERELLSAELKRNCVRLDNGDLLVLDAEADEPIQLLHMGIKTPKGSVHRRVISDNYVCTISEADALCCDWAFYIARAREGKGNHPVTIRFNSLEQFAMSLAYVDYRDLLESERFVLAYKLPLEAFPIKGYQARTDLSFLFEKRTRIHYLAGGLANLLSFYFYSKWLEEASGGTTYYDDTVQIAYGGQGEPTYRQIINEDISKRCFSQILSPKLISRIKYRSIADRLYIHGLSELFVVVNYKASLSYSDACPHIYIPKTWTEKHLQVEKYGLPYSYCFSPFHMSAKIGAIAKKHIQFPVIPV